MENRKEGSKQVEGLSGSGGHSRFCFSDERTTVGGIQHIPSMPIELFSVLNTEERKDHRSACVRTLVLAKGSFRNLAFFSQRKHLMNYKNKNNLKD